MRREVLTLIVVGLIIVSAYAGYLVGTSTSQSITSTTTAFPITLPSKVCTVPIPRANQTLTTEVYQIAVYSIGVICVTYQFQGNGSYSFSPTDYGPQISSSGSPWFACGAKNGSSVAAACSGLTITPYQPSINHLTAQNITVAYTVRTIGSPGVFWFFIGDCNAIPIAIGENPSFVVFPGFGCTTTPNAPTSVTVTGTWNINVTEASDHAPLP
jgi:hypothetical protein